jgi:transposase InsO family protein
LSKAARDSRKFRILTIIDEASREWLALTMARQLRHEDVLAALAELFIARGPPAHIRSDNGAEFIATAVQKWLGQIGVKTLYIAPGSPWENGYNGRLRRPSGQRIVFATSCSTARSSTASLKPGY